MNANCYAKGPDLPCKKVAFALVPRASGELAATRTSLTLKELEMARHRSRHSWSGQKWYFLPSYWLPMREKALGVAKPTPAGRGIGCNCFHL
jgi:hypothetical protein